jgi:hypothetical protein
MVNILPVAPHGTTEQMSPNHAAVPKWVGSSGWSTGLSWCSWPRCVLCHRFFPFAGCRCVSAGADISEGGVIVEEPVDQGGRRPRPVIAWLTAAVVPLAGSGGARRVLVSGGPDEARRRPALRGLFSIGRPQFARRASGRSNAQLAHTLRAMAYNYVCADPYRAAMLDEAAYRLMEESRHGKPGEHSAGPEPDHG